MNLSSERGIPKGMTFVLGPESVGQKVLLHIQPRTKPLRPPHILRDRRPASSKKSINKHGRIERFSDRPDPTRNTESLGRSSGLEMPVMVVCMIE